MNLLRRSVLTGTATAALAAALPARADAPLRLGLLRFGTAAWELDVIQRHGLAADVTLQPVVLASSQATQTALQAGSVDMIVQDWLWVSRLRASGQDWTLAPFSAAVGAVMAPADGTVKSVADLAGRRLGVAGTPLDKSWLILRAFAQEKFGLDLERASAASFGAPPLLSEQLRQGRLDAVLTYWPEAARLQAAGMARVLSVQDAIAGLGVGERVPITGYVFSTAWASAHRAAVQSFLAAGVRAQALLASSDAEWDGLAKLTGAGSPAELQALRDGYRAGIPGVWNADAVARLYAVLARIGGKALVGDATALAPGTFWERAPS